ncbi:hypothetical protein CBR_g38950 [Chara braunii]|uniref:Dehydrogenase/reductase SDR family member 4 n=1 Tax=Chara braunii TaxID=69332 RepID=A0A388K0R6_CHABU|nr:hypothetical protein CBR_g38950 [Chara braunii]|eukprot:GBG63639.1 hypothetical protein CBR_g38950 [Chara braunii]
MALAKSQCRRLEGRVAVVTASTAGIGLGIARRLGHEGASVVVSSRKQKNVDEAVNTLRSEGIDVMGAVCHVGSAQQRKALVKATVKDAAAHISPGCGSVIFISSISAFDPAPPIATYAITKTALLGLTKGLATELAPEVRVNCVAPGIVPTNFAAALVTSDEAREASVSKTLLGRLGTPADIGSVVAFLASDDASYITGETIIAAGGMQSRL